MKTATIIDFLSPKEIARCVKLKNAREIHDEIIKPQIERINKALGQENDPMYLSYAVEHLVSTIRE